MRTQAEMQERYRAAIGDTYEERIRIAQAAGEFWHADAILRILTERERELLQLKGPCSNEKCRLHYAHSGPCGGRE